MSTAAATVESASPEGAPVLKAGKKKLIVIGAVVLVVLLLAGGGVTWWLKQRAVHAAAAAADEDGAPKAHAEHKPDAAHPPTFLPLEPFVVNLADRDADRYAQIGITLEVESAAFAEQMKGYMPAVRNAILMIIAHKNSRELLDRSGKEELAQEIMREAVRPMGIEVDEPLPVTLVAVAAKATEPASATAAAHEPASGAASSPAAASAPAAATAAAASAAASAPVHVSVEAPVARAAMPRHHGDSPDNPIRHVHFSSFIIQ